MNKIPPAKEFAKENLRGLLTFEEMAPKLREFAKLHVQAALEAASEKAITKEVVWALGIDTEIDKDSILNAYNINTIK